MFEDLDFDPPGFLLWMGWVIPPSVNCVTLSHENLVFEVCRVSVSTLFINFFRVSVPEVDLCRFFVDF